MALQFMICFMYQRLKHLSHVMRAARLSLAASSAAPPPQSLAASSAAHRPPKYSAAELAFRHDLVDRFAVGKLDAVDLATIAWKAKKAGAGGVSDLAVDPDIKGENHARKVRTALNLNAVEDEVLYACQIPVWDATTASRKVASMPVKLPHEALARDFYNNRAAYIRARSDPDNIEVPSFLRHPIVQEHGADSCWPCGYYTDKVKLGNESFYRGSCNCTLMRSRITCWILKCSLLCRCGCNGLCTMDALQMEMNWSLNALQRDMFMESRFDRQPWKANERSRVERAGIKIGFRGIVNEYRADLPERCTMARIKTHQGQFACLGCLQKSGKLHDRVAENTVSFCPWTLRTQESYIDEAHTHLVAVKVNTIEERAGLAASLEWLVQYPHGRRVQGYLGRPFGLAANDQLIVSDSCLSPHDLEHLIPPFQVFFFRPRKESGIVGVSIMWNIAGVHSLGIDHFEVISFCECTLHTLDLGLAQRFCGESMVTALKSNIYDFPIYRSKVKLVQKGALRMGRHINDYYKEETKLNPWKKLSRLSKTFSHRSLGNLKKPCLKAKGGQTRGLVKFCTNLMQHDSIACKKGKLLFQAGKALLKVYMIMDMEPRRMSLTSRRDLLEAMVKHVELYKAAGCHVVYKHHGGIHLARQAAWHGNPKSISTYEDEHENGIVAKIGLQVHGATFAKSVFERLELDNPDRTMMKIL